MKRLIVVWFGAMFFVSACGGEQVRQSDEGWNPKEEVLDDVGPDADVSDDGPDACPALWQGAVFEDGRCEAREEAGCESPFEFEDLEVCCAENEGAEGCEEEPPNTCPAYWEGAHVVDGECVEGGASGCNNPFPYEDLEACCAANPEIEDCEGPPAVCDGYFVGAKVEGGQCVEDGASGCENPFPYEDLEACCAANPEIEDCEGPPNTCPAYWEGAHVVDGECVEGGANGCNNPFPYEDLEACCVANPGLDGCLFDGGSGREEELCQEAGGQWQQFPNTCAGICGEAGGPCGQAITWSCLCSDDLCWDGGECQRRNTIGI